MYNLSWTLRARLVFLELLAPVLLFENYATGKVRAETRSQVLVDRCFAVVGAFEVEVRMLGTVNDKNLNSRRDLDLQHNILVLGFFVQIAAAENWAVLGDRFAAEQHRVVVRGVQRAEDIVAVVEIALGSTPKVVLVLGGIHSDPQRRLARM